MTEKTGDCDDFMRPPSRYPPRSSEGPPGHGHRLALVLLAPFAGACAHIEPSAVANKADLTAATAVNGTVLVPQVIQEVTDSSGQFILIGADDGRWLRADDIDRHKCSVGVLICEAGFGRRDARYCECTE